MLSGRGLCEELITRPEESYRLCCVVVCDLETSRIGALYIYDISNLRVKLSLIKSLLRKRNDFMYQICANKVKYKLTSFLNMACGRMGQIIICFTLRPLCHGINNPLYLLSFVDRASLFIRLVVCLTTGPKPLPKRALHIVQSRASSFK